MAMNSFDMKTVLGLSLVQKYLTGRLLRFIEDQGVARVLSSLGKFSMEEAMAALQRDLGYTPQDRVRRRMVSVLVDLLCECGHVEKAKGYYIWNEGKESDAGLTDEEYKTVKEFFKGQVDFFGRCIAYADAFLRGESPLYCFNSPDTRAWEDFLGNAEFSFARSVLANVMLSGKGESARVLDLCYGPGFDILQIQNQFPGVKVTALDFKDIFRDQALRRIPNPEAVQWIDAELWDGFGTPLPFSDCTFDAVFFACADPYIVTESREYVYRDIFRVLKPGGAVSMLSRSYPDREREYVRDPWTRRGILCHDFSESVCEGWQGFYDARGSFDLFRSIGYNVETVMMNASIWRLAKPCMHDNPCGVGQP